MNTNDILATVKILFGNRQIVGRIATVHGEDGWQLYANLRNADGVGIREELLAVVSTADQAVEIKRRLMFCS